MARYMTILEQTNDGLRRQLGSDAVVKLDGRISLATALSLARDWVERRRKKDKEIAVVFSAERLSGKWKHIANTGAKSKEQCEEAMNG